MAKILITGDFCPIERITQLSVEGNHADIFNDLLPVIKGSDLAVTNLECPLIDEGKPIDKTGPALKAPVKTIESLKYAGFNLATLSNNHIMDYGNDGLRSTINACKEYGIGIVGAGENLAEARTIAYHNFNGVKVAILNFSENEFSSTTGDEPGANPLSLVQNYRDIQEAKANADFTIVIFHGGNEMLQLPSPRIKETFRFYADAGANCVIGHHTHCYSGYEDYNGTRIFYGLGNFVFDYSKIKNRIWHEGMAVLLTLEQDKAVTYDIIPYVQAADIAGVRLMNEDEHKKFNSKVEELNGIIADDELLKQKFLEFIKAKAQQYESYLEPSGNRIIRGLIRKKLLPSFLGRKKRLLYLNLIRCEAHRDVILQILKK